MRFSIGQSSSEVLENTNEVPRPKQTPTVTVIPKKQPISQKHTIITNTPSVSNEKDPVLYAIEVSWNEELVNNLWTACQTATNPKHCLWVGMSIAKAESNWKSWKHWYFWLMASADKSVENRVWRYNKYWYKATDWYFFYWDRGKLPPSRYCTSEDSSWSSVWCPNGKNNFNSFRLSYKKNFV